MQLNSPKYTTLDDEELVSLVVKTGETRYFGVLYDRYSNLVYNKCRSFAGSDVAAQDLTHDIFIKLFLKLKSYRGEAKFSTWLFSFVYNHCVNYYNRDLKKKNIETDLIEEYDYSEFIGQDEIDDQELLSLSADKLQLALVKAMPEDKVIMMMKYQDDMSVKSIATAMNIGESAVKMRLHRAKKRILELYNSL